MADQKIGVILDFKANTAQAKQSMSQLQQLLTQVSSGTNLNVNANQIQEASKAAKELAYHLSAAYNTNTGKLDLGKLNASLNSANTSISALSNKLLQAGTTGQQAFVQLAKSMSMAEAPAFKLNGIVDKLWGSLKNVATWQISSAILTGLTGSISEAYRFAQDLNESLTDIRIVTGKNADEMERFAKEANNAAKALSTTTTKYSDASLIYFQQGLDEAEVKKRTDLTIKMANVTGQSVYDVSDQLTAVWNNFDNGTESLQHYVDVMVALGAATASSSEEISEGLNKFAAVAETVGLSYDYAAAALATVTSTTRQSADIVGTAFKTLFARIQDLELGQTLDDGTTLGQYSQALASVGINIKDTNGQIKDMNIILEEMGARWSSLSKDTQIALAQNVAGVRQYTQLIALMDNWGDFQENLNTAMTSTGALEEQANIYAESWDAARDRVTASLESIYQDIIDDDFFIDLLNALADVADGVDNFLDKIGGIKPIIIGLSSLLLNSLSHKIQPALSNVIASIRSITPQGAAKQAENASLPMVTKINDELAKNEYNQSDRTTLENSKQLLQVKNLLWSKQKDMTEAEKQMAQIDLELIEKKQNELQAVADTIVKMQEKVAAQKEINAASQIELSTQKKIKEQEIELEKKVQEAREKYEKHLQIQQSGQENILKQKVKIENLQAQQEKEFSKLQKQQNVEDPNDVKLSAKYQDLVNEVAKAKEQLDLMQRQANATKGFGLVDKTKAAYEQMQQELKSFQDINEGVAKRVSEIGQSMIVAYQEAGKAAAEAGEKATAAFLEGKSTINLGSVSESFFANNREIFDAVGTKKAYSTINAKQTLGTLKDSFSPEMLTDEEGNLNKLGQLFNNAEQATNGKELKAIIEEIQQTLSQTNVTAAQFEELLSNFGEAGKNAAEKVKDPLRDMDKQYKNLLKKQQDLNAQVKQFKPQHVASGVEVFTKLATGVTSTVTAVSSLSSVFKQLKEDGAPNDLEGWVTLLSTIGFAASQAYNGYKGLVEGFAKGSQSIDAFIAQMVAETELHKTNLALLGAECEIKKQNSDETEKITYAQILSNIAKEQGNDATEESIKASLMEFGVKNQLCDETTKQAWAEGILNASKTKGTLLTKLQTAADGGSAIAKAILAAATKLGIITINAETGAVIANTAAWYANPIMWIAAIIVAVVAALAILTVSLIKNSKAVKDEGQAAKVAADSVKELSNAFDEAKTSAENLKAAISEYADALAALDELEEGTKEYTEALAQANDQARKLIETYGLWDDYTIQDGKIVFNEGVLEAAQAKANEEALAAKSAMYAAKIRSNQAAQQSTAASIAKDDLKKVFNEEMALSIATQAIAGNYIGAAITTASSYRDLTSDEVLTMAEAIQDFTDANAGVGPKDAQELRDYLESNKNIYKLDTDIWKQLDDIITNDTIGALTSLADSMLEAEKANRYYAEEIMRTNVQQLYGDEIASMAGSDTALAATLSDTITALITNADDGYAAKRMAEVSDSAYTVAQTKTTTYDAANQYEKAMKAEAAKYGIDLTDQATYSAIFGQGKTYDGNISTQDMLKDYYESLGYTNVVVENKNGTNNVSYTTTDENGNQVVETIENISNATAQGVWGQKVAAYLVEQVSQGLASETLSEEDAKKFLGPIVSAGEAYGADWSQVILKGIQNNGQFNFESIFGELSPSEHKELLAMSPEQLMETFGLTEEALSKLGLGSAEDFKTAFNAALEGWDISYYIDAANAAGEAQAEDLGIDVEEFKIYRTLLLQTNKAYEDNVDGLNSVALANKRLQKGIDALADDWSEINEVMSDGNADMIALSRILPQVNSALVDVLNIDTEDFALLPPDFAQKHWKLIEDVMNGVEGSVDKLRNVAGQEILVNVTGASDFTQIDESLQMLQKQIAVYDSIGAFEIGVPIDNASFISACNEILKHAKMTSEQAQAYFAAMGYDVEVHTDENGVATSVKVITASGSYGGGIGVNTSGGRDTSKIQKKKYNDEIERFYKEKRAIEDLQRELERLGKIKDRVYGANKITAIETEITTLNGLIDAQRQYNTVVADQMKKDQKIINEFGFSTDANGQITNYEEIMRKAVDSYNATGDEEAYNKIVDAVEQYNESLEALKSGKEELLELQYELQDLALEKITYEVEYKIELNEDDLKYLEWQLEKLNDPINEAVTAIGLLGKTLQENLDNIEIYKQGLTDIFESSGLTEADIENVLSGKDLSSLDNAVFTEDQIEAIREYRDALYECYEALDAFYDQIMERVNEAFEKMNEEAEETVSKIEHLGSMLSSYQNIVDIVGAKALGMTKASLQTLSKAQVESSKATLEALQTQLNANRSALENLQAARKDAAEREDTEAVKKWDEQIKIVQQTISDLEESVNDAWASALQAAAEDFQLAVELATQSFEEAMSGIYGSFEKMQEAYDQQKEISQRYVSNYQKIYELSKLNRDLNKSITETDSVKAKQTLMELQREINDLQESGVDLSEHDLEFLQKKYELRQAEIALEEAQNAKSQVRMQRDAEGNWGYVYTADANKTAEAEQSYEDKLYEIQKLEQDYLDEMEAAAIQAQINMVDAINSIRREDFESEEAYMQEVNRVREYYTGLYKYYIDESNKALSNSATIYNEDWLAYSEKTGYKIVANQTWRDQFNETFLAQTNGYKTAEDATVVFEQKTSIMCTNLSGAYQSLEDNLSEIFQTMGYTLESFGADDGPLMTTVGNVSTELDTITDALGGWQTEVESKFKGIVDAADEQFKSFQAEIAKYTKELDDLIAHANNALQRIAAAKSAGSELSGDGSDFSSKDDKKESGPLTPTEYTPPKTYTVEYTPPKTYVTNTTTYVAPKTYVTNTTVYTPPKAYTSKGVASSTPQLNSKPNTRVSITQMATGGYTGAWGSEGRLALLHQKELVLNAADTENFLSAVNIVRDISRAIDLRVAAQQGGLSAISKAPMANTTTSTLQQEVTIHAEFPNATQRTEIEAAFDTLLNRASQFANRKM